MSRKMLKKRGTKVTGVEYMDYAINEFYKENKIKVIKAPVWDMPNIKESYDIVLSIAVLQFIPMNKREAAAKEIYRLTKKWAFLVIPCVPQRTVPGEEWVLLPKQYEQYKDEYKNLVKFEQPEYWHNLFVKQGFERITDKGIIPPEREKKKIFILKKWNLK